MADLAYSPVNFGIQDHTISGKSGRFPIRIYYPADEHTVKEVPVRPGTYPLILFAHGERASERDLCPPDITHDFIRWEGTLRELARCGFVVGSPALHDVLGAGPEPAAVRLEDTAHWMRSEWSDLEHLYQPGGFVAMEAPAPTGGSQEKAAQPDLDLPPLPAPPSHLGAKVPPHVWYGTPTPLALVGHSWGARSCARVAVRGTVHVDALGSIAGSWDENAANAALLDSKLPTLMVCGTEDFLNFSYLAGFWPALAQPKFQAAIQGIGHWDWFGVPGSIGPCEADAERPSCPAGWLMAFELMLGFMVRQLRNRWYDPPHLLLSPGERPPLHSWFKEPNTCAMKIRWDDPAASIYYQESGDVTLGNWTDFPPW